MYPKPDIYYSSVVVQKLLKPPQWVTPLHWVTCSFIMKSLIMLVCLVQSLEIKTEEQMYLSSCLIWWLFVHNWRLLFLSLLSKLQLDHYLQDKIHTKYITIYCYHCSTNHYTNSIQIIYDTTINNVTTFCTVLWQDIMKNW